MSKLVYELHLPKFDAIKLDTYLFPDNFIDNFGYEQYAPATVIKPEWLKINNLVFNKLLMFYKGKGRTGRIHTDNGDPLKLDWGINWIHGGTCILEYWEDYTSLNKTVKKDILGNLITEFITDSPPTSTYTLSEGAYLVNASVPHRATGLMNRYAYSLRTLDIPGTAKWDEVVEKFNWLIKV